MILPTLFLFVILALSYYSSLAINGSVQAIVADQFGDPTAKELGYAAPNPFMYFEPINFLLFAFGGIYICPVLPINPFNIKGPFRYLKIFIIYFLEILSSIFIACSSLFACITYFGMAKTNGLIQTFGMGELHNILDRHLNHFDFSSFSNVIGLLLVATTYINAIMAVTILILNLFKYVLLVGVEKNYGYIKYSEYLVFLVPLIAFVFTFSLLYRYILSFIFKSTSFAAHWFGVI